MNKKLEAIFKREAKDLDFSKAWEIEVTRDDVKGTWSTNGHFAVKCSCPIKLRTTNVPDISRFLPDVNTEMGGYVATENIDYLYAPPRSKAQFRRLYAAEINAENPAITCYINEQYYAAIMQQFPNAFVWIKSFEAAVLFTDEDKLVAICMPYRMQEPL